MEGRVEIRLFGSFLRDGKGPASASVSLGVQGPLPVRELLQRLRLPADEVQLVMVNHRAVHRRHLVKPGDRVSIFPREYPIFADWKDFRVLPKDSR